MSEDLLEHSCPLCHHRWYGTEWDIDCPLCDGDSGTACRIVGRREVLAEYKPITRAMQHLRNVGIMPDVKGDK